MLFGEHLRPAAGAAPAAWIDAARRGPHGTVGALVPNDHSAVLRVHPPPPNEGDWWSAYRDVFVAVAVVGARHTTSPDRAWYAVWDGHGYDSGASVIAWRDPPAADHERRARERERERAREEGERRNAAVRAALTDVPAFDLPDRRYHLLTGPVDAVAGFRYPDSAADWRNPDLWWPEDRAWFVATDVDIWSLYVAGGEAFVAEVAAAAPTPTDRVTLHDRLEGEA